MAGAGLLTVASSRRVLGANDAKEWRSPWDHELQGPLPRA